MSRHRFVVMVEVDDDALKRAGRLDTPDTWDHRDLTDALTIGHGWGPEDEHGCADIIEIDDHEEFED